MKSNSEIELSVIIPVYNSELIVGETVKKTIEELEKIGIPYEIILVNDGSTDNSITELRKLNFLYPTKCIYIDFLKNYGQHTAVFCGIARSRGAFILTMDDDLQNPPSEIKKMLDKIREGYDLVFAKFERKRHSFLRKLGTKLVNFLNVKVFGKPKSLILTNYRIFTKDVALRVSRHKTFYPYIPGLLLMYSSKMTNVLTRHDRRSIGKSNYNFIKMLNLIFRVLFNYSTFPLTSAVNLGVGFSVLSFILAFFYVVKSLFIGVDVAGWTTVVVLISFFNGLLLIILGMLGQYIVRTLMQISTPASFEIKEESKR